MAENSTLYPYDVPPEAHPYEWLLLGFGLDHDAAKALAVHLFDKLGCTPPVEKWTTSTLSWAIDRPRYASTTRPAYSVGDEFSFDLSGDGAVAITAGGLPPGIQLDTTAQALVGTFTTPGLFEVTITHGPTIKYDSLGGPGGPQYPGIWIPVDATRAPVDNGLDQYDASTVDALDERAKDELLARLLADRDNRAAKAREA